MIFTRLIICLFLCYSSIITIAQEQAPLKIRFSNQWQQQAIDFPASVASDSLTLEIFRFYISQVSLWKDSTAVWKADNSYHLLDTEVDSSMSLHFQIPKDLAYDRIAFNLGIDSLTNVAGVMGGDLDPTKGMYWTWNTGYINLKLEGTHPACPTRKNRFTFHLGGYAAPYLSMQSLSFPAATNNQQLTLFGNYSTFR